MNITHLNQWLSDREVKAICWTLIHSLWQGLLIAALAGLVIALTRKASAQMRYQLFCALLVTFLLAIGCTFIYEIGWAAPISPVNQAVSIAPDGIIARDAVLINGKYSFLNALSRFLNGQAAGIFAIWLVCFLYKSIKLLGGIFYIHRIRTQKTVPVVQELKDKVSHFAKRINIRKPVAILQSELVKIPVTLGYLKPLIMLPAGIILQLSAEQIDTILWHELAHIRRRDYLVNILQSIVEAIFFFNPAILWLSALIREEREACYDDIVLANVQQKGSYLEALMAFQGQYTPAGSLAMALSLRPNQLMNRLRRMVYQENKKLSMIEMAVLLCGLLLFSAFTFIPEAKPALKNSVAFIKKTITHTFPESQPQELPKRKYTRIKIHAVDTATNNNPVILASDTTMVFKSIRFNKSNGDRANQEINVIDGQNNRYHIIIANGQLTSVELNNKAIAEANLGQYQDVVKQINAVMDNKKRIVTTQLTYTRNPVKKHWSDSVQLVSAPNPKKLKPFTPQLDPGPAVANPNPKKHIKQIDNSADQARARGVIQELVNAGVVANATEVESFGLSDTELMVNGKKQFDDLQRKLKVTYGIKPKYGLFYGPVHTRATGIILDKSDL